MHVIILLNIINVQAHQRVQTVVNREAGKPMVESSLVAILINIFMNDNKYEQ